MQILNNAPNKKHIFLEKKLVMNKGRSNECFRPKSFEVESVRFDCKRNYGLADELQSAQNQAQKLFSLMIR